MQTHGHSLHVAGDMPHSEIVALGLRFFDQPHVINTNQLQVRITAFMSLCNGADLLNRQISGINNPDIAILHDCKRGG